MKTLRLLVALLAVLLATAPLSAQATSLLSGTVVTAGSGVPVPDAILRVAGTNASAVSDAEGRFVLRGLPVGSRSLEVRHPDFGEHAMPLSVSRSGEQFTVTIQLSTQGMSIEIVDAAPAPAPVPDLAAAFPVTVTEVVAATPAEGPAVRGGTVVDRERILQLAGGSRNLGDLIRRATPTLQVRNFDGAAGDALCLEFRGTTGRTMNLGRSGETCNNPSIYLDGVALGDPAAAYSLTAFEGLQWIQVIPPGEAGAQFGQSTYGVILIATRSGGTRMGPAAGPGLMVRSRRSTFDWEQDPNGHNFLRTFLGAAAGNAAGLAAGLAVGRQCIFVEEGTREIDASCGKAGVVGVGVAAFALPAMGSALGAHFGGSTGVSVGKWVPALLGASMAIFPGYAFSLTTVGGGVQETNAAGKVFLLVGTPLLTTVADRLYRTLRTR